MEESSENNNNGDPTQVLRVLHLLKQASQSLQNHPNSNSVDSINALLELESESDTILSLDPHLSHLSSLLSHLKSLSQNSPSSSSGILGFRSFLRRRASSTRIARLASDIESELQSWIDRESITHLADRLLHQRFPFPSDSSVVVVVDSDELTRLLTQFRERVLSSSGFSREFQDLVLRSRVFSGLESVLCDGDYPMGVRENCGAAIEALIVFNKDVFVSQVLTGSTIIRALLEMETTESIRIVSSLIRSIKSPLVDEIESNGGISTIMDLFGAKKKIELRLMALDCVMEIGYFGRKEAIEAMMGQGLIEKLVELQMSELGGDLIEMGRRDQCGSISREEYLKRHPFASCVARFAVQLEVGEGLRQREKRAFKQEMLRRVREECGDDVAEAATIVAEILWGSYP